MLNCLTDAISNLTLLTVTETETEKKLPLGEGVGEGELWRLWVIWLWTCLIRYEKLY